MNDYVARAFGFVQFDMWCQRGADVVVRAGTLLELGKRYELFQSKRPDPKLLVELQAYSALRKISLGLYENWIRAALVLGLHQIGNLLLEHHPGQETKTLLRIGKQLIGLVFHIHVLKGLHLDMKKLNEIDQRDGLGGLPAWDQGSLEKSLSARMGALKAQDEGMRNLLLNDIPSLFIGYLTLMAANSIFHDLNKQS